MALSFKQSLAYFWEQIGKQFVKKDEIPQPDWASFAEEPGYIENRTHYINLKKDTYLGEVIVGENVSWVDLSEISNIPVPVQIGVFRSGITDYSNVKNVIFEWNGKTYYSRTFGDANNCIFGSMPPELETIFIEDNTDSEEGLELIKSLAISECPGFFLIQVDTSQPTLEISVAAFVNPTDYKDTLKIWSATGDGEIKKLDNIFLNDDVIIVEKAAPKTILNQIDIVYEEDGTDSGYYYIADKELIFEANKEYDLILNGKTYSCYANNFTLYNSIPGCLFGNIPSEEFPGMIGNPDANFVMFISSSFVSEGVPTTVIMFDSADTSEHGDSFKFSLIDPNTAPADAWVAKDANGNVYWEEKTHGIIKGDGQVIVPVREYTVEELEGLMFTQWPQLQEGARYSITCGTATWETVCSSVSDDGVKAYVLGDIYGIMNGQDGIISDPPILILQVPGGIDGGIYNVFEFDADFNIGDVLSGESILFGITKSDSIKKLDSKYIDWPDTIPVLSEKDGNVYLEVDNLEGTFNDFYNAYVYPIEGLENVHWEEGCYYTVKTDNNTVLLQCMHYPGDMDTSGSWMLMDPFYGTVDGYAYKLHINALANGSLVILYSKNIGALISKNAITSLTIQDKQTYLNKINKYAIPDRLPLMPGSGSDSFQTSNYDSQASGIGSIALRRGSQASGDGSLAIGSGSGYQATQADGQYSIAINFGKAFGSESIACVGGKTTANALRALAYGDNVIAGSKYQIVLGKNNILDSNDTYGFIFGNGLNTQSLSNALTINWNGNVWAKNLYMGGTSEIEGASKVATEAYVNGLIVPPVLESTAGKENAAGPIGKYASGTPGMNSFTWGIDALAAGGGSIAMGTCSTTTSSAHWGVALGTYAAAKSGGAVAIGQNVTASDTNAVAIGEGVNVSGMRAVAIGNNLTSSHDNQVVLGTYNINANYSLLLGNGSGSGRSNAFGVTSTGTGYFAGDLYVNGTGTSSTFSNAKKVATESYVDTKVAGLVDSAPGTLDTLNELAAALGDDPNFATTVATEIGKKADKTDLVALTEAEILEVCGVAAVAHVSEVTW